MYCKSLWINASAKCIKIKRELKYKAVAYVNIFLFSTSIQTNTLGITIFFKVRIIAYNLATFQINVFLDFSSATNIIFGVYKNVFVITPVICTYSIVLTFNSY